MLKELKEILYLLYKHGWDERNGGNLSYILTEEDIKSVTRNKKIKREIKIDFDMSYLIGRYLIVTGTGTYFKNMLRSPKDNLGIVKVLSKDTLGLIWGYESGGRPTSEFPTHLKSHIERLKVDPNHRVVMHCHPTSLITMTHVCPCDSKFYTEKLWKMQTESIIVFPDGVSILPWMVCGGNEIGDATAELMKECRSVVWSQHGIFATGHSLDETFGLIETIEKAAYIYMKTYDKPISNSISNENLIELAKAFNVNYKKGIID